MIFILVLLLATPFLLAMFTVHRHPRTFSIFVGPFRMRLGDVVLAEDVRTGHIGYCRVISIYHDGGKSMATVEAMR